MAKDIDKKLLEGLTFSGATGKKNEKTGKMEWIPFTRPLTEDDILSGSKDGKIIVTKDGKKYDLTKTKTKKAEA
jgi:hemin uptake protein HemP